MRLIALRPCSFDGHVFLPGAEIPIESVIDPVKQEQYGVLVRIEECKTAETSCVIHCPVGSHVYELTPEACEIVFEILLMGQADATKAVKSISDVPTLQVISALDKRKTVDTAILTRLEYLGIIPEDGDE